MESVTIASVSGKNKCWFGQLGFNLFAADVTSVVEVITTLDRRHLPARGRKVDASARKPGSRVCLPAPTTIGPFARCPPSSPAGVPVGAINTATKAWPRATEISISSASRPQAPAVPTPNVGLPPRRYLRRRMGALRSPRRSTPAARDLRRSPRTHRAPAAGYQTRWDAGPKFLIHEP